MTTAGAPVPDLSAWTVTAAARSAERLLAEGTPRHEVWRLVVLQLLDDYRSVVEHLGHEAAASLFTDAPPSTGDEGVDAALAALAEHVLRHDGHPVPQWVLDPARLSSRFWFVTPLKGLHAQVLRDSPLSFRTRGVFISADALVRV